MAGTSAAQDGRGKNGPSSLRWGRLSTDVPHRFAEAVTQVSQYVDCALGDGARSGGTAGRSALRRQAYRALSDLRAEFQRAMSGPPAISRRSTIWWPAVIAPERTVDAVTAAAVTVSHSGRRRAPASAS